MICAVEWKRLFSVLKIFKIGFLGVHCNIPFFLRNLCGKHVLIIFFTSGTKVRCMENISSYILSSYIRGFFYSPRSYMKNVLKINCGILPSSRSRSETSVGERHLPDNRYIKSILGYRQQLI